MKRPTDSGSEAPLTKPRRTPEQLRLLALCKGVSRAPTAHPETDIGEIQNLVSRQEDDAAIESMGSLLLHHSLDSGRKRYPIEAERFKSHREIAGLTQQALADRIGVQVTQISHYETGVSGIGIIPLLFTLSIMGIHSSELLSEAWINRNERTIAT